MLAAVLLAGLLAAGCFGAAVPTEDTLVITGPQDASTSPEIENPTTEEPLTPIKLLEMDVRSEVALRYAQTSVVTKVKNAAARAQETTFRVLLPETAFISGFLMILNGKPYKAYVKEKEEAKQIYNQAVSHGVGAAHIATKARDSNHFTVSVNVEPRTEAVFNLTYEELLVRSNGVYNQAINLHPGALVPSLKVTVHIKESQKITALRVPEVRTGNEIDATSEDKQNPIATVERGHDDREATITFSPDLDEQRRLIDVYIQKSKESTSTTYRRPWHSSDDGEQKGPEGVLGQFVVQYDVERPKDGEILVSDGYFVHFFAPSSLPPLSKHVVFVMDTSGSMMDLKIKQLREALVSILDELNKGDFFSIVEFSSSAKVHELKEADEDVKPHQLYVTEDDPVNLVPPFPVNPENIAKAKIIVNRLIASGGTNIALALDVAVNLVNRGVDWKRQAHSNSSYQDALETTTKAAEAADKEERKVEPIIIFLTDGDPTVGETDTKRILNRLVEKNSGPNQATIFSLAFGENADRSFLRKVALRNAGFMRHIYEGADAVLQLRDFYRQVASPLLSHVNFTYPANEVVEGSVTSSKFRNYYAGSERAVAGRVALDATELNPSVEAFCGVDDSFTRKKYRVAPKVPVAGNRNGFLPLERVWAYLTVQQLLEQRDATIDPNVYVSPETKAKSPEKRALELALQYEFVTPLTSLVVVKPNATRTVDADSVDDLTNNAFMSAPVPISMFQHANYASVPSSVFQHNRMPWDVVVPDNRRGFRQFIKSIRRVPLPVAFRKGKGGKGLSGASQFISAPILDDMELAVDEGEYHLDNLDDTAASVVTSPSPLDEYHLQGYSWMSPLIDLAAKAIRFQVNGTEVILKLSKTHLESGEACDKAMPSGVVGRCVYVTQCDAAQQIDLEMYKNIYCSLGDVGYAGVCCPPTIKDSEPPK